MFPGKYYFVQLSSIFVEQHLFLSFKLLCIFVDSNIASFILFQILAYKWTHIIIMFYVGNDLGWDFSSGGGIAKFEIGAISYWGKQGWTGIGFLRFLLKNGPLSVVRVFFQEDCPDNMHNKLLDLEKQFSKFSIVTRKWPMKGKMAFCEFCEV